MRRRSGVVAFSAALASLLTAPVAAAFDGGWVWDKEVRELGTIGTDVATRLQPTSHIELAARQRFAGDVVADTLIRGNYGTEERNLRNGGLPEIRGVASAIGNSLVFEAEGDTYLIVEQFHEKGSLANMGLEGRAVGDASDSTRVRARASAIVTAGEAGEPFPARIQLDALAISNLLYADVNSNEPNRIFYYDVTQRATTNIVAEASAHQDVNGTVVPVHQAITDGGTSTVTTQTVSLRAQAIGNYTSIRGGESGGQ